MQSLKPKFDAKITEGLPQFTFADTDGNKYVTRCALEYFNKLNETFGYFIDTKQSVVRKDKWIVMFSDEEPIVEKVLEVVPVIEPDSSQEEFVEVLEKVEYLSYDLIDWPRMEALKNTKDDKSEMDVYASKFGVSLKKNKTITNMLEDFKAAVGV